MNNMNTVIPNIIGGTLVFLVIMGVVFLLLREVICWYWKINQSVGLLTEIRDLLAGKQTTQAGVETAVQQNLQGIDFGAEPQATTSRAAWSAASAPSVDMRR